MPSFRPTVLLCGSAPPSDAVMVRALLAHQARVFMHAPPGARPPTRAGAVAVPGELDGVDAIRGWVARAWTAAKTVDAVVIYPAMPATAAAAGDGDWQASAATLRATFFLAQQIGVRLQRARRGQLILAIGDQHGAGTAGAVLRDGLICMADGLGKALADRVAVATVVAAPRSTPRATPAALAAAVAAQVAHPAAARRTVIYVGGPPARG